MRSSENAKSMIKTYKEKAWVKLRQQVLRRDQYLDQIEKRYGRMKNAELVHHIFPVEDFPEFALKSWNLISISKRTHNRLHDIDGSLSKEGKELLEKTARKNKIPIPYEYLKRTYSRPKMYYNERGIDE